MIVNHPLTRTAREKAAIAGALALMACGVATLAFELDNEWTMPASLIVAAICSLVALRNILDMQTHRGKGSR
jgi:hypothetical protein